MGIGRRRILFVISAPSGTGKTTICERILQKIPDLKMSVSHTTRKQRPGERHGIDYYFVDKETFQEMIKNEDFVEWAEVYGNFYGTSKKVINELLSGGSDILLDIDTQGAKNIKKLYPASVLIFILPPSIKELERRLKKRNEEEETIRKRIEKASEEISQYIFYDYVIINDDLERAVSEVFCVICAERLKKDRINGKLMDKFKNGR